jgi:putative membrane protein
MEDHMRKMALLAAALLAGMAGSATAQSIGEKSGANALVGRAPSTADFVTIAAVSDMFEIESSKLAQQKGDANSKAFAAKMVADHSKTSAQLKSLAANAKVELPKGLDSSHQGKIDKLNSLNGAEFDDEYDSMQVAAHKDAVSLFERYAKNGDHAGLKAFAAKTLPHLQQHLKMAQELK